MEISGPCLLTFHNGQPCHLYEVVAYSKSPKGFNNTRYFFTNWEDAEIYTYYLYQEDGVDFLRRVINSRKIPAWEKQEYKEFLGTLNLTILKELVKDLHPVIEKSFVPHVKNKGRKDGNYPNDDCEEYIR